MVELMIGVKHIRSAENGNAIRTGFIDNLYMGRYEGI